MLPAVANVVRASWSAVAVYWLWHARRVKRVERREGALRRFLLYILPLLVAGSLLLSGDLYDPWPILKVRFVPELSSIQWLGAVLTAAGAALALWARWLLGRNWSVAVQLKRDHQLVRTGPYAVVRHPIYSGFLLGFLGTAIAIGEVRALLAVVILAASFVYKLRIEERWMREHFGAEYDAYTETTSALVPGLY